MRPQHPSCSLSRAFRSVRRLRRGRTVARFNGWSEGVFGGLAVLFGIFSFTSLLAGAALLALAWRELRWARELGRLNPAAPRALALNQLVLLAGVLAYCAWQTYTGLTGPGVLERYPELAQLSSSGGDVDFDALYRTTLIATYAGVAVLSVILQGLTAWWYASLRAPLHVIISVSSTENVLASAAA